MTNNEKQQQQQLQQTNNNITENTTTIHPTTDIPPNKLCVQYPLFRIDRLA